MFPEQRTYSEWRASTFAAGGVVFEDGRFGGTKTAMLPNTIPVSTCQDCHMPDVRVEPCQQGLLRSDVGLHAFAGANTWVQGAVLDEYGAASGMTEEGVAGAQARAVEMLEKAADVEVTQQGYTLGVRVVNQSGHRLPTGYPEGRRMWLGVRFFAGGDPTPIGEDGAYDAATATLDVPGTTRIYEAKHAIAADVAAATGLAAGTPFHLVLNGAVVADNRIPPRGFAAAAFDAFGGAPVPATYADGQHWDDVEYGIPLAATRVEVSLYYQTTTKEYAEFLRDTAPDASGQNAYDRWVARGRSAPVLMDRVEIDLDPICSPDGSPCDDANACTTGDTCVAGACTPDATIPCPDDGNPCTEDVCVPATGTCGAPATGTCDDGDPCTTSDVCAGGACGGAIESFEGFRCGLDALGDACGTPLPRGLARALAGGARKARRLSLRIEKKRARGAAAKAIARLFAAADRVLAKLDGRVVAAAESTKPSRSIAPGCAAALRDRLARERDGLARLE
jgi:hypothetical protein